MPDLPHFDNRDDAWKWLVAEYGDWSYDDPEWVDDMLEALTEEG